MAKPNFTKDEKWEEFDRMSAAVCERCSEVRRAIGEAASELGPPNPPELDRVFGEMLDKALMHLDTGSPHSAVECLYRTYSPYGPVDRVARGVSGVCHIENAIFKARLAREKLLKEICREFPPGPFDRPERLDRSLTQVDEAHRPRLTHAMAWAHQAGSVV